MAVEQSSFSFLSLLATLVPFVLMLVFNATMGAIAVFMAKKRGLKPVPAFFAAFFISFPALFIIAMFPVRETVLSNELRL